MAKDNQRQIAQGLYIDQCLTAKDIAVKLDVSEKTISQWVNKGNWRELRLSKQTTTDVMLGKYNELLNALLDKRLLYEKSFTLFLLCALCSTHRVFLVEASEGGLYVGGSTE